MSLLPNAVAPSRLRARMEKLCTEPKPDFLPCTGNPQPDVTWLKDGHPLPGGATSISPDGSVLRIPQAAPSDAGRYSCVASNPVGEQTKHYLLNVSGTRCFGMQRLGDMSLLGLFECLPQLGGEDP